MRTFATQAGRNSRAQQIAALDAKSGKKLAKKCAQDPRWNKTRRAALPTQPILSTIGEMPRGVRMPLYIRDHEADELAERVKTLTGAATKTEAVKIALRNEVARLKRRRPLSQGLGPANALASSTGPADPSLDSKAVTDELWDEA
jgi:antitoxin VapB